MREILWCLFGVCLLLVSCQPETQPKKPTSNVAVETGASNAPEATFKHGEDGFAYFVKRNMVIPKLARYYGINGSTDIEVTIDTSGQVISVRGLTESMNFSSGLDTTLMDFERKLMGNFALEAERLIWMTNGYWNAAVKDSVKRVSTLVLTFDFNTQQFEANEQSTAAGSTLSYGQFDTLALDPTAGNFYQTGTNLLTKGYYTDAVKFLTASIRIDQSKPDSWFNLGLARRKLQQNPLACQAFQKAAELGDQEAARLASEICK